MLRRSFTFLGLMLTAWLLVVWARAGAQSPDLRARNIYMETEAAQVPAYGFADFGGTRLSRVWASSTQSTPGLMIYNPNGEYSYLDVQARGGGGLFVHAGPLLWDAPNSRWIRDSANQNWVGLVDGGPITGWELRTQAFGTEQDSIRPITITFTPGCSDCPGGMSAHRTIQFTPSRTIALAPLCFGNAGCLADVGGTMTLQGPLNFNYQDIGNWLVSPGHLGYTCDDTHRRQLITVMGIPDHTYQCMRRANGSYGWVSAWSG